MLNDSSLRKILIKTYKLTPSEERLFFTIREIYFFWGESRGCYASNEILAEETNMSSSTIKRSLKILEDKKLITLAYEKTKGFLTKRNIYPLEDEILRVDAEALLSERSALIQERNEVFEVHNAAQDDSRTMFRLDGHAVQCEHINNQSLNNQSLNNKKDICDAQNDYTYINSRLDGADAPVATSGNPHLNHQAIKDRWNAIAEKYKLQTINIVSPDRIASLKARIKDIGGEEAFWSTVERAIKNSAFLRGQNNRKWRVTFNWILKPSKFIQMAEGAYSDSGSLLDDPKKPIQEAADDDWITDFFTFDKEA